MVLLSLCACSTDDDSNTDNTPPVDTYFNFTVNGVTVAVDSVGHGAIHSGNVSLKGDIFSIRIVTGRDNDASYDRGHIFTIQFDRQGNTLSALWASDTSPRYRNYKNFPDNYFDIDIISLDEVNHKIKVNFSGTVYRDWTDMNSESNDISGELDVYYAEVAEGFPFPIMINSVEQYCGADFNGTPWKAYFEHENGVFYSYDPYKVEIHFANSPSPGSYAFDQSTTDNYVRFYKFNPVTMVYDQYEASGTVAYSYREFHGGTRYSFIGTFNLTAVNPNNPSDTITVTNGNFRSYQQY